MGSGIGRPQLDHSAVGDLGLVKGASGLEEVSALVELVSVSVLRLVRSQGSLVDCHSWM